MHDNFFFFCKREQEWKVFFVYFFGGLECVGHSFAYVAHLCKSGRLQQTYIVHYIPVFLTRKIVWQCAGLGSYHSTWYPVPYFLELSLVSSSCLVVGLFCKIKVKLKGDATTAGREVPVQRV